MKAKIAADLPHVRIHAMKQRVEDVILGAAGILDDASLIVSALGNWSAERMLDGWHRKAERKVSILYTWTESRACAGHALTVSSPGSSLQQGFDETELPRLGPTQWPGGDTKRHEPACGSVFEPYGPVELGFITALGAEHALDTLLGTAASHREPSGLPSPAYAFAMVIVGRDPGPSGIYAGFPRRPTCPPSAARVSSDGSAASAFSSAPRRRP